MPPLLIVIFVMLVVIIRIIFHISFENAAYATVVLICVISGAIMGIPEAGPFGIVVGAVLGAFLGFMIISKIKEMHK